MLAILTAPFLSSASDKSTDSEHTLSAKASSMEATLMQQVVGTQIADAYKVYTEQNGSEPCRWRGVRCTKGRVTTVKWAQLFMHSVDIRWLPHSVEKLHLAKVTLTRGWLTRELPFRLRYFFTSNVTVLVEELEDRTVDLTVLPPRMRELHVLWSWWAGPVVLYKLPQSMRMIQLTGKDIRLAYVDCAVFQSGMKRILLHADHHKKAKIHFFGEGKVDGNIMAKDGRVYMRESKYYQALSEQID